MSHLSSSFELKKNHISPCFGEWVLKIFNQILMSCSLHTSLSCKKPEGDGLDSKIMKIIKAAISINSEQMLVLIF